MTRPDVSALTETTYARLPALYRDADEAQGAGPNGFPLLRYLAACLDPATAITDLLERITYYAPDEAAERPGADNELGVPTDPERFGIGEYGDGEYGDPLEGNGDLADPTRAEAAWLPWLAQFVGITLDPYATLEQQRSAITDARSSWGHGTPAAIQEAGRRALSGDQYLEVIAPEETPPPGVSPTSPWLWKFNIRVRTRRAETPTTTTWGEVMAVAPTWGERTVGAGVWSNDAVLVLMRALGPQRPAGYRFVHDFVD